MPQRKRYLFVCTNSRPEGAPKGSCAARGAVEIHAALKAALADRGLAKVEARACTSSCIDVCWAGPVIAVEPDGFFLGRVTLADVPAIANALERGAQGGSAEALKSAEGVARLVLPPNDFDEATAGPPLKKASP